MPETTSVVDGIAAHVAQSGGRVALDDGEVRLTYGDLISQATALAASIAVLPDPASPIGVFLPGSAPYVVSIVALLMAGRTSVSMNDSHPDEAHRRVINHSGMSAVIVDSRTAESMHRIAPTMRQLTPSSMLVALSCLPPVVTRANDVFAISYTSGSTGEPKGVCRTERSLTSRLQTFVPALPLTSNDRVPILESMSVGMSVNLALNALVAGAQVGIIDARRLGLNTTIARLVDFRPSVYAMVSSTFHVLFGPDAAEAAGLSRDIRWLRLGGDPVLRADVDLYRRRFPATCRLFVAIGAGETGTFASWGIDHTTPLDRPLVPVGYPERGVELELLDDDGAAVAPGEVGEIYVTSTALALGYWRDEALTNARFNDSPRFPGMFRYRTGDFGRFLPEGLLELVGRRDRQIKIRGNTVHPGEVEAVLSACAGVAQVGVVPRTEAAGTVMVAYCTPAAGCAVNEGHLRRWCRDHLSAPMRPTHFFVLETLPRLPSGKLDLIALAAQDGQRVQAAVTTTVTTASAVPDVGDIVRRAWTETLGASSFDADTAFDAAGGDSLNGLTLVARLEALLGSDVGVGALDMETRPSQLIERLAGVVASRDAADNARPFIALFPGMWGDDVGTSAFYRRLSERFRVLAIDYRLGGDSLAGHFDGARYFAGAIAAIRRAGPHRRLWLAGYSYGGKLAAETARRLRDSGTAVEAVIVFDGEAGPVMQQAAPRHQRLSARVRAGVALHDGLGRYLLHVVAFRMAKLAVRRSAAGILPPLFSVVAAFGTTKSHQVIKREVIGSSRHAAFGAIPKPLPMAVWLFVSDEPTHDPARPDLGWKDRCLELHRIPVGGDHLTFLSPPTGDAVIARLGQLEIALRAARGDEIVPEASVGTMS